MDKLTRFLTKNPVLYRQILYRIQRTSLRPCMYTTIESLDPIEILHRQRVIVKGSADVYRLSIRSFMDTDNPPIDVRNMTEEEVSNRILDLMSKSKDKKVYQLITDCTDVRKSVPSETFKRLFRNYSYHGRPDMIAILQKYCSVVDPYLFKRNGEFTHYLAKSHCMKGNAEKGLSLLMTCYKQNEPLRSFYRIILRELIQDSILNRSEASLVIFKKYVLEFSSEFQDHYPLICFWHLAWSSSWFSDQVLSDELLEVSAVLQEIIRDKAMAFSMSILRQEYNEDAVLRLLQSLLKYNMMEEYVKVLQVLFSYKLKQRDIRGCTEIIKNCEVLGIQLSPDQQGRYIRMLIDGKHKQTKPTPLKPPSFKLKF